MYYTTFNINLQIEGAEKVKNDNFSNFSWLLALNEVWIAFSNST